MYLTSINDYNIRWLIWAQIWYLNLAILFLLCAQFITNCYSRYAKNVSPMFQPDKNRQSPFHHGEIIAIWRKPFIQLQTARKVIVWDKSVRHMICSVWPDKKGFCLSNKVSVKAKKNRHNIITRMFWSSRRVSIRVKTFCRITKLFLIKRIEIQNNWKYVRKQNGRRGPFWMSEIHFRSHFWPFQIDTQLYFFWNFLTKWLPSAILDVRNWLLIAFLAIFDQY